MAGYLDSIGHVLDFAIKGFFASLIIFPILIGYIVYLQFFKSDGDEKIVNPIYQECIDDGYRKDVCRSRL